MGFDNNYRNETYDIWDERKRREEEERRKAEIEAERNGRRTAQSPPTPRVYNPIDLSCQNLSSDNHAGTGSNFSDDNCSGGSKFVPWSDSERDAFFSRIADQAAENEAEKAEERKIKAEKEAREAEEKKIKAEKVALQAEEKAKAAAEKKEQQRKDDEARVGLHEPWNDLIKASLERAKGFQFQLSSFPAEVRSTIMRNPNEATWGETFQITSTRITEFSPDSVQDPRWRAFIDGYWDSPLFRSELNGAIDVAGLVKCSLSLMQLVAGTVKWPKLQIRSNDKGPALYDLLSDLRSHVDPIAAEQRSKVIIASNNNFEANASRLGLAVGKSVYALLVGNDGLKLRELWKAKYGSEPSESEFNRAKTGSVITDEELQLQKTQQAEREAEREAVVAAEHKAKKTRLEALRKVEISKARIDRLKHTVLVIFSLIVFVAGTIKLAIMLH